MVFALERDARCWLPNTSRFLAPLGESMGMDSVLANLRRDVAPCCATGLRGLDSRPDPGPSRLPSTGVSDLRLWRLEDVSGESCLLSGIGLPVRLTRG